MQGERDVLTRIVFPELRRRAAALRVRVVEIDLRWGVTAHEATKGSTLAGTIFLSRVFLMYNVSALTNSTVCLKEVDRCRPFFLGLLGSRYGWCPDTYLDSAADSLGAGTRALAIDADDERFAWLRSYPAGRSVTELEMAHAVLLRPDAARAAFYIRDERFMHDVPGVYCFDF